MSDDLHFSTRTKDKTKLETPRLFKVILHNDDYTPMDFVVDVLVSIFRMDEKKAMETMLTVHTKGECVCGVFSYEVAETKVARVHELARGKEYPLKASMEME